MKLLSNIKTPTLKTLVAVSGGLFVAVFSLITVTTAVPASAATEGCYEKTSFTGATRYDEVTCPSVLQARLADPADICFFTTVAGSADFNDFTVIPCEDFASGVTRTVPTTPATNPNSLEINDALEADCDQDQLDETNCGIISVLTTIINYLSAAAGMVMVGSVMFAGFQYMTARDNSGQIMKARLRIVWTLVAIALYVFMYAMLNFLIPGGLL